MGFFKKLVGKQKGDREKADPQPPQVEETGTVLRQPAKETPTTQEKDKVELTTLEIAEQQDWKIKTLPVWQPGDVILDTYEVEAVFSGGMGHVYIAYHKNWHVKLAIKSPNQLMLENKSHFARILREANSWIDLGLHPNIAYCYYVRAVENIPHIFVEYVPGGNLRERIQEGKCNDYRTSLDLAIQFCHGMEHAHGHGMIHRDIKPENILIAHDGHLKITDFGLVRMGTSIGSAGPDRGRDNSLTYAGDIMGTEGYMAPEQIEAASGVDERADIFSFGVCLYEMLCGNRPYPTTIGKPIEAPDPAAVGRNKDFPRNLATLLIKCVQWYPNNRPDSFSEIRDSLNSNYRELFRQDSPYHALRKVELDADGFNNRGVSLYELGRFEEAANNFRRALEIQSSHPQASHNLSLLIKDESCIQQLKITEPKPLYQIERMERDLAAALEKVDTYIRNGTNNGAFSLLMDTWARSQFKRDSRFSERYQRLYDKRKSSGYNSLIFAREEASYIGHAGAVNAVSFSPDGKHALSAGADKTLRLWKIETGQCVSVLTGHTDAVNSVGISADGRYALSGSSDTTVRLWELSTAQCLKILKKHSDAVNAVVFLSDVCLEALPAVSEGRGNIFSSLGGGSLLGEPSKINTPRAGQPSALSGGTDKDLHLWDLNAGVSIENFQKTQEPATPERIILLYQDSEPICEYDPVLCIAVDHEGKRALTGSSGNSLILWDIEKKKRRATLKGHTDGVNSVAFSPNRSYAVSGSLDNTIRLWNLDYRTSSVQSEHHSDAVTSLSISSDGSYILSGSMDETIRLWGMSHSYLSCEKILDHGGPVTSVCFSPDSQYALSAGTDGTIKLWRFFWSMDF